MKEHQHIEWKESWRDEYLKWISGFANAEGGVLVIGRNDKGTAVGVDNARKLLEDLPNKVRDVLGIMVAVNLLTEAGRELVEIRVEPYPSPISYKGQYHYRSGSTKQWNPGQLPQGWTLKRLLGKHPSNPPNPLLANAFFRAGYIEAWGRGIEKIRRECREHDIEPPIYDFEMSGLMLRFHANPEHLPAETRVETRVENQETPVGTPEATPEATPETTPETRVENQETLPGTSETLLETLLETLPETPERILTVLAAHRDWTLPHVSEAIGKSRSAVQRAVNKLVKAGRLRHVGPRKGGHWEVLP